MTAQTLTRTNSETWADWLLPGQDPGPLISREELVEAMSQYDVKPVTTIDLRYWEAEGVIPRSIKRRHNGATRATYPKWMISMVLFLRIMQNSGHSLEKITEAIRLDYRKNIDHPELGQAAQSQGLRRGGRHVVQLSPEESRFLSMLVKVQVDRFLNDHQIDDMGYVDVQIFGKNGDVVDSKRYVPSVTELVRPEGVASHDESR